SHLQDNGQTHIKGAMDIRERLKAARKHANLTQLELERAAGVDQTVISNIERGIAGGSKKLPEMAAACGVNIDWLTLGRGLMTGGPYDTANASQTIEEASVGYEIIPQYTAVGECGAGLLSEHSEIN